MASQSAPSKAGASAAEVQQLEVELERLRAYKVVAERNLEEMGFSLQAALRQGWVSKRAEGRRRRLEKKKAAEAAKWAKADEDEAWLRKERKKVGLPVRDPTPTPSEAAYLERVADAAREEKAERLRNRVRRMSHQLLIAAAIRKQYREINMADQSGHVVPGGTDPSVPLQHRRFDARSETSLSAAEAMARSFRNWANKEKRDQFRSRSHTPETVMVSSRTTGPEDSTSGSGSDSSFTDDDAPPPEGPRIAGPKALRAVVYDPPSDEDDIIDAGEELGGIADLDFDDVSDEVMATAYAMLATAEHTKGEGDWADTLADSVLSILLAEKPNTPSSSNRSLGLSSDSDSDTDTEPQPAPAAPLTPYWNSETDTESSDTDSQIKLAEEVKQALNIFQISPDLRKHGNTKKQMKKNRVSGKNKASKTQTEILQSVKKAIKHLNKQQQSQQETTPKESPKSIPKPGPKYATKATQKQQQQQQQQQPSPPNESPTVPPSTSDSNDDKGPSHRAPHKPAAPSQSVYDPTWWRVNVTDPYDGLWASKVLPPKQPTDQMETGFVTWREQETRFPHLDDRLELRRVYGSVIYNPGDVGVYTWDPLNRAVTEPKTGVRAPLRLGPITVHSLARWRVTEFGTEYPRDPVRLPDNPSVEDKKRSLSSATLSKPKGAAVAAKKTVAFASGVKANMAVPMNETPIASVHYPLRSPTATSISRPYPNGHALGQPQQQQQNAYASAPPTPYPWHQPETPTVALYEHNNSAAPSSSFASEEEEESSDEEQDRKLATFLQELHAGAASGGTPNTNGKRTGGGASSSSPTKKRRTTITAADFATPASAAAIAGSGSSDSEKENGADADSSADASAEEPEIFRAAAKEFWNRHQGGGESGEVVIDKSLFTPSTPGGYYSGGAKKSVRFDIDEGGPSRGMRSGARRALGRYGLTAERRGELGPYR